MEPAAPNLQLKCPLVPFGPSTHVGKQVIFLHPGYNDNHNILLILPAHDSGGVHHETARVACAILANSRWDGFLSLTANGSRIDCGPDDILMSRRYYFRIDGGMYASITVSSPWVLP